MIRSMTGFGDASGNSGGSSYAVELRSVNNKYFKAIMRLPEEFQPLEPEIEALLRRRLNRGSVTVTAARSDETEEAAYAINAAAIGRYIRMIRQVPEVGDESPLDIASLLQLPGVLQAPGNDEARTRAIRDALMPLLETACDGLIDMRAREGKALRTDLAAHHDFIADRLEKIAELAPGVVAEYEKRLKARIEVLLQDAELVTEPSDLIREVAVYAEKTDVAEEITRLREHLVHFAELLAKDDDRPIGRTLDFLSQELLREANTIASKSPDATVSKLIVEIKGAIDRIKEQVQNVE